MMEMYGGSIESMGKAATAMTWQQSCHLDRKRPAAFGGSGEEEEIRRRRAGCVCWLEFRRMQIRSQVCVCAGISGRIHPLRETRSQRAELEGTKRGGREQERVGGSSEMMANCSGHPC